MERELPFHVVRMLDGGQLQTDVEGLTRLLHGGVDIPLDTMTANNLRLIVSRIEREICERRGIKRPFSTEEILYLLYEAQDLTWQEIRAGAEHLRVLFLRGVDNGPGFYRVVQPLLFLRSLIGSGSPLRCEESSRLSVRMGANYDMIVAPRIGDRDTLRNLYDLKKLGCLIVYETDDLLTQIPHWNPNWYVDPHIREVGRLALEISDACLVATPELRNALGRPEVTHVVENGINPKLWPMSIQAQSQDEIRILWAGSDTHKKDLEWIVPALRRLQYKHKGLCKRLVWVFVGYAPDDVTCSMMTSDGPRRRIKSELADYVVGIGPCSVFYWPSHLASLRCHMAVAPLVDHPFNQAKSELKCLEAWALGIPILASRIAPYERAMEGGVGGELVNNDPMAWEVAIERMLMSPERRLEAARSGLARLRERYVMSVIVQQYERALFTIARGRVKRPECNVAIEARLKEMSA
jgi:glycosyltransferase involved in cell wall biosynthesis